MEPFMLCVLLALAPGDSLPTAFFPIDGGPAVYTVAEVQADTLNAYACYGLEPVIETPEDDEVLVLGWLPALNTGVDDPPILPGQPGSGACGAIFSIKWR